METQPGSEAPVVERLPIEREKYLWFETGVVFAACLLPWLYTSWTGFYYARGPSYLTGAHYSLRELVSCTGYTSVILFVIWRSGDLPSRFGLRQLHVWKDCLGCIGAWLILRITMRLTWIAVWYFTTAQTHNWLDHEAANTIISRPDIGIDYVVLGIGALASGWAQELLMRGYLIPRLEELLGSKPLAIFVTAALFSCYHSYESPRAMIRMFVWGVVSGVIFCRWRRLMPLALAHSLDNFLIFCRVPIPWI